jgi:photosystem II stability/assembly factor-like uncharacterized protein
MQLMAPGKGWARGMNGHLFWTDDNGARWRNITPKWTGGEIASIFFMDESRAWVLLEAKDADNDTFRFELATTIDNGHSWSLVSVPVPTPNDSDELSGAAWVNFADAEHGWIVLKRHTSSAFSIARLLATKDGGKTWYELPQMPVGAPVLFVSPTDGWTIDNFGGGAFCQTHDGGKTWDGVDLGISSTMQAMYSSLRFSDQRHGSVAVMLSPIPHWVGDKDVSEQEPSKLVLFTTDDGGKSWKHDRELPNLRNVTGHNLYGQSPFPSSLVDSTLLVVPTTDAALATVGPAGTVSSKTTGGLSRDTVFDEISFVSPTTGWLRTNDDKLLSTTDGGETFTWLVPGSTSKPLPPPPPDPTKVKIHMRKIGPAPLIASPIGATPAATGLHYTERLGFDKQQSFTYANMTTWWAKSPFFDVGFYVGGANYCYLYNPKTHTCTTRLDPNVNSKWITKIMSQGWGLMPIWVGKQAPCNTTNVTKFSQTPATAQSQGTAEAASAAKAMAGLELQGTLIFYDMENYTAAAGSACSLAVRAFLTGWIQGMNANGFATTAVYGNPGPAERDFSQVTNLNEVWITQVVATGNHKPRVTIWGLGSGANALEDDLWNSAQRGHQFLIDAQSITYGGVKASIDYDVENFQIPGAEGVKVYTWNVSSVDLSGLGIGPPSPCSYNCIFPTSINDVVGSSTNTNSFVTVGQVGQIVGSYVLTVGCDDCEASFIVNNRVPTVDPMPPGAPSPLPYSGTFGVNGINNLSNVVGWYCGAFYDSFTKDWYYCDYRTGGQTSYATYDFSETSPLGKPSFSTFQYATNGYNYFDAITDYGLILGFFYSPGGTGTYFTYQNSTATPFNITNCPGQAGIVSIGGMNGFGQMAGLYADTSGVYRGFIYNTQPPDSPQCVAFDSPGYLNAVYGINNQGQVFGLYTDENEDTCYFMMDHHGTLFNVPFYVSSFNDAAQVAGLQPLSVLSNGCVAGVANSGPTISVYSPI